MRRDAYCKRKVLWWKKELLAVEAEVSIGGYANKEKMIPRNYYYTCVQEGIICINAKHTLTLVCTSSSVL